MSAAAAKNWIGNGQWAVWALLVGLLVLFVPETADPYSSIRWATMALVGLVAWLSNARHWKAMLQAVDGRVLVAMAAFCLMGFLSMTVALHPLEALWDTARWLMVCGLMVHWAWCLRERPQWQRAFWRAGTVAGLLLSAARSAQWLGLVGGIPEGGDTGAATLGNPNFFDGAVVMLAAFGIGVLLRERGLWRWIGLLSAMLCIFWAFMALSSGALLALAAMGVVLLEGAVAMRWPQSTYARSRWIRPTLATMAALAALAAFGWVMTLDTTGANFGQSSALERVMLWQKSAQMIGESPLLGIGAGHWHHHILRLGVVSSYQGFATRYFMEAHNDYLHLMAERGILGGIAFIGIVGLAWRNGWRRVALADRNPAHLAAWAGLTAWMAFAATNLPGEQSYLSLLLVAFVAALIGRSPQPVAGTDSAAIALPTWQRAGYKGLAALLTLGTAICLMVQLLWLEAEQHNYDVLIEKESEDWPSMRRFAAGAKSWYNPDDRLSGTPLAWYEGVAYIHMNNAPAALPYLLEAKAQSPWHPQVGSILGAAYFMVNDHPAAIRELEDLVQRFEAFDDARINLTEIYMVNGQFDLAAKTIDYWRIHPGNPTYDNYYHKIMGLLEQARQLPPQ
jgi:O-antigen ligase